MKRVFVLIWMVAVVLPVFSQESELVTRTTTDGVISLSLPQGWVLDGGFSPGENSFMVVAASSADVNIWELNQLQAGNRGIFMIGGSPQTLRSQTDLQLDFDQPLLQVTEQIAQMMVDTAEFAVEVESVETINLLDDTEAGYARFHTGTGSMLLLLYRLDTSYALAMGITYSDELADFEVQFQQIIPSLIITPPEPREVILEEVENPRRVIMDADMASEDYISILYLLNHPAVEVIAITVSATGEAHCEGGMRSALALLVIAGKEGIPVACGSEIPLAGDHEFPAEWRAGADSTYGLELPEITQQPDTRTAPQLILDLVAESEEPVSIIAVGPLTNIAQAIQQDAEIMSAVESISIMGGAVRADGNVMLNRATHPIAEWNIYIDPLAASIVLQSGIPIRLVPLDATEFVPITTSFFNRIREQNHTPETGFVVDLFTAIAPVIGSPGFHFWDSLTAASFTDEHVAQFEEIRIRVIEDGRSSGRTMITQSGVPVLVAVSADRAYFEELLLAVLNR